MQKIIYMLGILVAMTSCSMNSDSYTIEVDLDGTHGKWVKLMAMEDRNYMTFDSVLVES